MSDKVEGVEGEEEKNIEDDEAIEGLGEGEEKDDDEGKDEPAEKKEEGLAEVAVEASI